MKKTEAKVNKLVQKIRKKRELITEMRIAEKDEVEIDKELMELKQLMDESRAAMGIEDIEHHTMDALVQGSLVYGSLGYFPAWMSERADGNGDFVVMPDENKAEKNVQEIKKLQRKMKSGRVDLITKNALGGTYL